MNKKLLILCSFSLLYGPQNTPVLSKTNNEENSSKQQDLLLQLLTSFCTSFPEPDTTDLLPALETSLTDIYQNTLGLPDTIMQQLKKIYYYLQQGVFDIELAQQAEQIQALTTKLELLKENDPLYISQKRNLETLYATYAKKKQALNNTIMQLIKKTASWQHYLKLFIIKTIDYEATLLKSVYQQEKLIFPYIPTIETAYYSEEYTSLMNGNELARIFIALNTSLIQRAQADCIDWASLTDPEQLYDKVADYKKSDFYQMVQTLQESTQDTKTYPFPSTIQLVQQNQQSQEKIISIKALTPYFSLDPQSGTLSVTPLGKLAFGVDTQGNPYFTSLGNLLFTLQPATTKQPAQLTYTKIFTQLFTETPHGFEAQPLYTQIIGLQALAILNGAISYLFNTENIDVTMQNMTKNAEIITNTPVFFHYRPQDYLYLQEINRLSALINPTTNNPEPQSFFHHFFHSISHAFHSVIHLIKNVAEEGLDIIKDTGKMIEDAGDIIKNTGLGLYYSSGLACIGGMSYSKAQQKGEHAFNAAAIDIQKASDNFQAIVTTSANIATQAANEFGSIPAKILGTVLQDPHLTSDLSGFFDTIADTAIHMVGDMSNFVTQTMTSAVKLTFKGVSIIADIIIGIPGALGAVLKNEATYSSLNSMENDFIKSIVTSILSQISLAADMIGTALKAVMMATAYLANSITDVIADVGGMVGAIGALITGQNIGKGYKNFQDAVQEHRRLISGIVTTIGTIAMVGISIPTGGGAFAVSMFALSIAMNGMMVPGLIGDAQQDQEKAQDLQNQNDALTIYKQYVQDSETAAPLLNILTVNAARATMATKIQNTHYTALNTGNYTNSYINAESDQAALQLGSFYAQGFTPDSRNDIPFLDTGYYCDITTQRYGLNPNQGITLYNYARNSFSQEVACAPTQIGKNANDSNSSSTNNDGTSSLVQQLNPTLNQTPTQFWLNQKDISAFKAKDSFSVEIRFRSIYETGGAFYIGLFMTEKYLDTQQISALYKNFTDAQQLGPQGSSYKQQAYENFQYISNALLDFDALSRSFVFFRTTSANTPTLGLYQHEGKEWINNNISGPIYQRGIWYRMRMSINNDQTSVACWQEGTTPTNTQSFTLPPAQPLNYPRTLQLPTQTGSYSQADISPSSSIPTTSQQLAPTTPPKNTTTKNSSDSLIVKSARGNLIQLNTPSLQTHTTSMPLLNTANTWQIQEQSMPSLQPQALNMSDSIGAGSFGVISSGAAIEYQIISPESTITLSPLRLKENQKTLENWQAQQQPQTEAERELQWQKDFEKEINPQFGTFTLKPASKNLISQGVFLYTTASTNLPNKLIDYVAFASSVSSTNQTVQNIGINPLYSPTVLVSLVTGNAYTTTSNSPIPCKGTFQTFTKQFALPKEIKASIQTMSTTYFKNLTGPFIFKNITLTANGTCLQDGLGLYSAKPIDSLIKSGLDYFVCAQLDTQNTVQNSGMFFINKTTANSFVSLISGNIYQVYSGSQLVTSFANITDLSKLTLKKITSNNPQLNLYTIYQSQMSTQLYNTINAANLTYQESVPTPQTPPAQPTSPPVSQPAAPVFPTYQSFNSGSYNDYSSYSGNYGSFGSP